MNKSTGQTPPDVVIGHQPVLLAQLEATLPFACPSNSHKQQEHDHLQHSQAREHLEYDDNIAGNEQQSQQRHRKRSSIHGNSNSMFGVQLELFGDMLPHVVLQCVEHLRLYG